MATPSPSQIELEDDVAFQERFWKVERFGWGVFCAIIVAALLGLTGAGGWLSRGEANISGAVIDYPRVARWQATDVMRVRMKPAAAATAEVEIAQEFFDVFEVSDIQPAARRVSASSEGVRYEFELQGSGGGTMGFSIRPRQPAWLRRVQVEVNGQSAVMQVVILP